jgi:hypothetical protein
MLFFLRLVSELQHDSESAARPERLQSLLGRAHDALEDYEPEQEPLKGLGDPTEAGDATGWNDHNKV